MRLKRQLLPIMALLLIVALVQIQCGDSEETTGPVEPQTEAVLCLTMDSCNVRAICDSTALIYVRNCGDLTSVDWFASTDQDWLSLSTDSGSTPGTFRVIAEHNGTSSERSGTVTVTAPGADSIRHVTIVQKRFLQYAGSYNTEGNSNGVFAVDNVVLVADGYAGLTIIDASDPSNPTLAGSYDTPDYSFDVVVFEGLAYVADWGGGLQIVDPSNIAHPTLVGSYENFYFDALGVSCFGDRAYIAANNGYDIIDISNPEEPSRLTGYGVADFSWGVYVDFGIVYVTIGGPGLLVHGYSTCDLPGASESVMAVGNYAYVAAGTGGLQIVDVSDKANPTVVGSYATSGEAHDVHVYGNYAFVVDGGGLYVVDVTDPTNPTLATYHETPGEAWGVYVADGFAYVGDNDEGLQILEIGF